jgi:hypothetical protein
MPVNHGVVRLSFKSGIIPTHPTQGVNCISLRQGREGAPGKLQPCPEKLAQSDRPNLWKPRPDQFFHIDALPCLGTGKLELRKAREMATERSAKQG